MGKPYSVSNHLPPVLDSGLQQLIELIPGNPERIEKMKKTIVFWLLALMVTDSVARGDGKFFYIEKVTVQALGWWPNDKFQPLADRQVDLPEAR